MTEPENAARLKRIRELSAMIWDDLRTTYLRKAKEIGSDPQELAMALSACAADMHWTVGTVKDPAQVEVCACLCHAYSPGAPWMNRGD